ncbi:MAG: phosphate ABC transporter permease subunit PstC [Defluviitaleaceae bacterium]|nr:phosphate ABC transporter permease subunit PstC [Defluviitaleaceae bacterium]
MIFFIFAFVFMRAWPVISANGFGLFFKTGFDRQIDEAFRAGADSPLLDFGLFGLIMGTVITTLFSVLFAAAIGVGGAVVIKEFTPRTVSYALISLVRLLSSIPSVIFGLIGIILVVPMIQDVFVTPDLQIKYLSRFQITGRGLLASIIVLTFMLVPTVAALSSDAIAAVPKRYRETGFAFGMTHFRVIWKIILPTSRSGIIASVILATGRGIGEAIAVSMVCGGIGLTPDFSLGFVSLLTPVLPLSSAIINKSEGMGNASVASALFACAAILLLIGAFLSIAARLVDSYMRKKIGNAH